MKKLLTFLFLIVVGFQLYSQNELFVRVYDTNGKKITKGRIISADENLLRIKNGNSYTDIQIQDIGTIRTKRSVGNNILIGTSIGAGVVGIAGAASADPDAYFLAYTAGEGAMIGMMLGAPMGAIVGTLSSVFKNSKKFAIDGDLEKWKIFLLYLSQRK